MAKKWKPGDDVIKKNVGLISHTTIGRMINRPVSYVSQRIRELGLVPRAQLSREKEIRVRFSVFCRSNGYSTEEVLDVISKGR